LKRRANKRVEEANRRNSVSEFNKDYFRSYNYEKVTFKKYSMYWWARRYYAGLIRRRLKGGRIIEIGCGLGHLLGNLEGDFETYGVDISAYAIEEARRNAPRTCLKQLSAEEVDTFGPEFFDGVIILHVVEHLKDPLAVLKSCNLITRKGGLLLFTTPNLKAPFRRLKGKEWQGIKDKTHISLHEPEEWRTMAEDAGYHMETLCTDGLWNVPYLPLIPSFLQLFIFGTPAAIQVLTCSTFNPVWLGENLIIIARKL
jgi:2-polyprenyl-3-methyl-5-hydroxy-6-metoxy-1,4-benzoquinol methylase